MPTLAGDRIFIETKSPSPLASPQKAISTSNSPTVRSPYTALTKSSEEKTTAPWNRNNYTSKRHTNKPSKRILPKHPSYLAPININRCPAPITPNVAPPNKSANPSSKEVRAHRLQSTLEHKLVETPQPVAITSDTSPSNTIDSMKRNYKTSPSNNSSTTKLANRENTHENIRATRPLRNTAPDNSTSTNNNYKASEALAIRTPTKNIAVPTLATHNSCPQMPTAPLAYLHTNTATLRNKLPTMNRIQYILATNKTPNTTPPINPTHTIQDLKSGLS